MLVAQPCARSAPRDRGPPCLSFAGRGLGNAGVSSPLVEASAFPPKGFVSCARFIDGVGRCSAGVDGAGFLILSPRHGSPGARFTLLSSSLGTFKFSPTKIQSPRQAQFCKGLWSGTLGFPLAMAGGPSRLLLFGSARQQLFFLGHQLFHRATFWPRVKSLHPRHMKSPQFLRWGPFCVFLPVTTYR
jgi:hypothetical protein